LTEVEEKALVSLARALLVEYIQVRPSYLSPQIMEELL